MPTSPTREEARAALATLREAVQFSPMLRIIPAAKKSLDTIAAALAEPEPQWTREVPTEPGWYFKSRFGHLRLCEIERHDGNLYVMGGLRLDNEHGPNTWWQPAIVPAPPSEAKESE